ncbi:hypothetical protein KIH75_05410 [Bifidobacterium sp. 64T4]|uniref:hypothetical protein n=1 Tax=Bifidobacterium pongonis TaxID=2834432 RepID=UPI001C5722E5|nr:hypothetical protein [Bifidobacterium pongonis]MBW3094783.1 hypothetical protein [Bifidobacterium pongonis]
MGLGLMGLGLMGLGLMGSGLVCSVRLMGWMGLDGLKGLKGLKELDGSTYPMGLLRLGPMLGPMWLMRFVRAAIGR